MSSVKANIFIPAFLICYLPPPKLFHCNDDALRGGAGSA